MPVAVTRRDPGHGRAGAVLVTMPTESVDVPIAGENTSVQITILSYTSACFVAAVMVWLCLRSPRAGDRVLKRRVISKMGTDRRGSPYCGCLRFGSKAIVIVGAYCTFKDVDYYSAITP